MTNGTKTITIASSITQGYTKLNSLDGGDAKLVATNTTLSSTQATFKTLTAGSGISLTNGTKTITITSSGSGITKANNLDGGDAKIFATNSSTQVTAKTITNGAGITVTNGTKTLTITSTITQGYTKINNVGTGTIKLVQTNASNTANIKSITTTRGITLTNGTTSATIDTNFKVNTKTSTRGQLFNSFDNSTSSGNFGTTTLISNTFTCAAGTFVSSYDNSTGVHSCTAPTGVTTLANNVTGASSVSSDTNVWTITLTANSGNSISGMLDAVSGTTNNAVQAGANVTNLGTRGYCKFTSVSTTTADAIDNIAMNTVLTGRATNTGETVWLSGGRPQPILFDCALTTGATPGSLKIWFNNEIAATTIAIKAGSYYIKTP